MNLYEACLTLLQVYSKNNLGRQRIDVTAEEEQYQDLLLIMELLTNLLSKEFIDFSDTGNVCEALVWLRSHGRQSWSLWLWGLGGGPSALCARLSSTRDGSAGVWPS